MVLLVLHQDPEHRMKVVFKAISTIVKCLLKTNTYIYIHIHAYIVKYLFKFNLIKRTFNLFSY